MERVNDQANEILALLQMVTESEQVAYAEVLANKRRYRFGQEELSRKKAASIGEQILPDQKWLSWLSNEQIQLNQKIALALVESEEQKLRLSVAVGREQVLRKLIEQRKKSQRQKDA